MRFGSSKRASLRFWSEHWWSPHKFRKPNEKSDDYYTLGLENGALA